MTEEQKVTCIYCDGPGPFSDEHVIPAGLGGDDSAWLLKGCVCQVCNTDIFSKLETKFLRASPVALARLFLQPHTRGRAGHTGTPSVQPGVSYHHDPETNLLFEIEMGAGGASRILPQLIVQGPEQVGVTGSTSSSAADLLSRMQAVVAADVMLIEKLKKDFEVVFRLTPLEWDGEAYVLRPATEAQRPPKGGIWQEPLQRAATVPAGAILTPRIFARAAVKSLRERRMLNRRQNC
jgi:hypothetical protein